MDEPAVKHQSLLHIGIIGTNEVDQRLYIIKQNLKSKKWPVQIFIYFFFCSVVNSFILRHEILGLGRLEKTFTVLGFIDGRADSIWSRKESFHTTTIMPHAQCVIKQANGGRIYQRILFPCIKISCNESRSSSLSDF